MRREVCPRDPFFSRGYFCLGLILGFFVVDRRGFGFSALFRSLWNPLGISVEDRVLEIVGSDSESGLELGEFSEPCQRV
jgi:hypothetical protein